MKDTSEKMERIYNEMMMKRTPEERVKMCFSMLNTARRIVLSTIEDKKNWRKEMFLRFYGDDFTQDQKEKIFCAIERFSINNP
jgi:hypothetical protein